MNGVIYCRVSSKEQVEGTSLESQELACREFALRNDIQVVRVFIEQGESAKFADRTQLLSLLDYCRHRSNKVSKLLVWKVDRFARNVADHYSIKAELLKHGVDVISVTEPIDGNPEGKLLETILAGFAQFDNDLRAARTVSGMRRKIQEGIFPWKPPLGYLTRNQRGHKKSKPDVPDESLFPLLRKAWTMYATGAYRKTELIELLTAWGVRTKADAPIAKQTIANMLSDPFYAGVIRDPWSGEEHVGQHVPLVTREVFSKIQEVNRNKKGERAVKHMRLHPLLPLRSFARCAVCGHYVTGGRSRGRSRHYFYYRCFQHDCPSTRSFPLQSIHEEFSAFLASVVPSGHEAKVLRDAITEAVKSRNAIHREVQSRANIELERLKKRQRQLILMRADEQLSKEDFVCLNAEITGNIASLSSSVRGGVGGQTLDAFDTIIAPIHNLERTWATMPLALKGRFQRSILPVGFVIGQIGTAEKSFLFSTFSRIRNHESLVVPHTGQFLNHLELNLAELAEIFRAAGNLQDVPRLTA